MKQLLKILVTLLVVSATGCNVCNTRTTDTCNKNCIETLMIKKQGCPAVRIPCSGLLLKDYCALFNLQLDKGVENVDSHCAGNLKGMFYQNDGYRYSLYFDSTDQILNYYLLDVKPNLNDFGNKKIAHMKIVSIKDRSRFDLKTDTLFLSAPN